MQTRHFVFAKRRTKDFKHKIYSCSHITRHQMFYEYQSDSYFLFFKAKKYLVTYSCDIWTIMCNTSLLITIWRTEYYALIDFLKPYRSLRSNEKKVKLPFISVPIRIFVSYYAFYFVTYYGFQWLGTPWKCRN